MLDGFVECHLASLSVDLSRSPVRIGNLLVNIRQENHHIVGTLVHGRLIMSGPVHTHDPHVVIFDLHFVMLWFELHGVTELDRWYLPWQQSLRQHVRLFAVVEVKEAMQLAVDRFGMTAKAPKYYGGIMRRKKLMREGRIANCGICGGAIELDSGEHDDGSWVHTSCKEKN